MNVNIINEKGYLSVEKDVVAKIAGIAATNCYGVVGMAVKTVKDGIVHLLKKESLTKGVEIAINENNDISIKLHIIVEYGTNIQAIGKIVYDTVQYKLQESIGIKCSKLKIYVEGIRAALKRFIINGANKLAANREKVDLMNVFPVPDGDTGTNMSMTITAAARAVENLDTDNISEVAKAVSDGALRGARGNSGVILSQILRGWYKAMNGKTEINADEFAKAFEMATATAYKAVMKPKEGTMLTVIRAMSEKAVESSYENKDIAVMLKEIIEYSNEVLAKTPDMLPQLKEAGVVDSGGQGLIFIVEGGYENLGIESDVEDNTGVQSSTPVPTTTGAASVNGEIKFGYCTEFFVNGENLNDDIEKSFGEFLAENGDSIVLVRNDDLIKVHVHSNHPGKILEKALEIGSLENMKIENMRLQHTSLLEKTEKPKELKEYGFVAVSVGDGLKKAFEDLGVDYIIQGGQTMNPSIEDITNAIEKVNAKNVFVLPNNKNIILAAEKSAEIIEDKNVKVVGTTSVIQGLSAMLGFMEDTSIEENYESMVDAISEVNTGLVTVAVRDTTVNGIEIKNGKFIGIENDEIVVTDEDIQTTAKKLVDKMIAENDEACVITVYYGSEVTENMAEEFSDYLSEKYGDMDIEVTNGGQPVYGYIVGIE